MQTAGLSLAGFMQQQVAIEHFRTTGEVAVCFPVSRSSAVKAGDATGLRR